ncbi:hypothetical protein [Ilumatobacter sp.]|uniref:hypothetical protein n=1 Tax=Ilumatobacter sp. TaxID=1967498 RepID=UPI003C526886
MRSWCKATFDSLGDYIMKNGWIDPTGSTPPLWFGHPEQPESTTATTTGDPVDEAA